MGGPRTPGLHGPDTTPSPLEVLRYLVAAQGLSVSEAIRHMAGRTTVQLAADLNASRQSVEQCLTASGGRVYPHVRRAIEMELDLPANALDEFLPT